MQFHTEYTCVLHIVQNLQKTRKVLMKVCSKSFIYIALYIFFKITQVAKKHGAEKNLVKVDSVLGVGLG